MSRDHVDPAVPAADPVPEAPGGVRGRVLRAAVERALRVQQPLVSAHIAKIRRKDPGATPAEVYADPQTLFVAGFLGTPRPSLLEAALHVDGDTVLLDLGGQVLTLPPSA